MPTKKEELSIEYAILQAEINKLNDQYGWKKHPGGAFVVENEYRVLLTPDAGSYMLVEQVTANCLFFGVNAYSHYYGCIKSNTPNEWFYVLKGQLHARAEKGNYSVHSIQCRYAK